MIGTIISRHKILEHRKGSTSVGTGNVLKGRSLWILSLVLSSANVCFGQDFDEVRIRIREALVEGSIPSITVAVGRGDQILWEGKGLAGQTERIRFRLLSTRCITLAQPPRQ